MVRMARTVGRVTFGARTALGRQRCALGDILNSAGPRGSGHERALPDTLRVSPMPKYTANRLISWVLTGTSGACLRYAARLH